jgi:protein arginine kinase activator
MNCESCKEKDAVVHLVDVSNNSKAELHLCKDCAESQGTTIKSHMQKSNSPKAATDELPAIFQNLPGVSAASETETCGQCGTTYRQFRSSGKFGCPECYASFNVKVSDLLEKIHGRCEHRGKVPSNASEQVNQQKELQALYAELDSAVSGEDYERAAELRDEIQRHQEGSPGL